MFRRLLLPELVLGKLDLLLVAQLRNGGVTDRMAIDNGHLLLGAMCRRSRSVEPVVESYMESPFAQRALNVW